MHTHAHDDAISLPFL